MTDDQTEVIAFLAEGAGLARPPVEVEQIETHAARVFLIGERAYKLKRAVRYSFLDFGTVARRRTALEAELRLNRRTAPDLYCRVLPITREVGRGLALDGRGEVVDWVLEMARFDQDQRLDRLAVRGELDEPLIEQLAEAIADFHEAAEVRRDRGGAEAVHAVLAGNFDDLAGLGAPAGPLGRLKDLSLAALARDQGLLDRRRAEGRVRHCHGDLHLANIVRLDGRPVLFDCLEFDEALATIDTLYDLAFLLMDLVHRGRGDAAGLLLDSYLERQPDDAGTALLPLFMSCRAAIRAKVEGFEASADDDPADRASAAEEERSYLDLALGLLAPAPARLVAIGGRSGTGKSTLGRRLAPGFGPAPGAHLLRSDRQRKRLCGVALTQRLGEAGYQLEVTSKVYAALADRAAVLLRAGRAVIVDAVFGRPDERAAIEAVAGAAGVPFTGLWLEAPETVLEARVAARTGDASDATVEIVRRQRALDPGPIGWQRLDASGSPEGLEATALQRLHD
jgi:hypothetical protein